MGGGGSKPAPAPKLDVVTVAKQPEKPTASIVPTYNGSQTEALDEEKNKEKNGLGSTGSTAVPSPAGVANQASGGTLSSSAVLTG